MQLNNGKFELNNRAGYVLKPVKLRSSFQVNSFDPYTHKQIDGIVCLRMRIRVLSGIFVDVYEKRLAQSVTIEIYGLPHDSNYGSRTHRVNAIDRTKKNFNVHFTESGFNIPQVNFKFSKIRI